MTGTDLLQVLALGWPFLAVNLLMALSVSDRFPSRHARDWIAFRIFRPLEPVLWLGFGAFATFKLISKPDDFFAWIVLACAAVMFGAYLRGRKAKSHPEMGTSE
jgi:hypothetical protein